MLFNKMISTIKLRPNVASKSAPAQADDRWSSISPSPAAMGKLRIDLAWWERFSPHDRLLIGRNYLIAKRIMDLLLVILTSPAILFLIALCAILIKLESPKGPVFFLQQRTGKDGRRFKMYKFRTMVPNAEALKKQYAYLNELAWPDFKITNDPRITKMGRFLRKTSLDELPQIINIWLGDMSLVGPRPTSFTVDTYDRWHTVRLEAVPGLTGLWQVIGRAELEFDDRVRLDFAYLERRCLTLDFLILLYTVGAVFRGK